MSVAEPTATDEQRIPARDGLPLAATFHHPEDKAARSGIVIVNPATSVRRQFYAPFAAFLAARGHRTVTYDYRGIGGSLKGPVHASPATMHDWGQLDFAGVVDAVSKWYPGEPIHVVGHSVGGQIVGLSTEPERIRSVVLVAAQSGYWRLWPKPARYGMAALWTVVVPGLTRLYSYLPAKRLGSGENLPPGVALEWARWGRHPEFFVDERGARLDMGFANLRVPVLAYSFKDDMFAPPRATDWLADQYKNAQVSRVRVAPRDLGVKRIGHFGFFKRRVGEQLWPSVAEWFGQTQAEKAA